MTESQNLRLKYSPEPQPWSHLNLIAFGPEDTRKIKGFGFTGWLLAADAMPFVHVQRLCYSTGSCYSF